MVKVRFPRLSTLLTAMVGAVALALSAAGDAADEPAQPDAAPAETPAEETVDPYAPPAEDASEQEVTMFMRRLARMQPDDLTQEGFAVHFNKVDGLLEQLIARKIDTGNLQIAGSLRFQVLSLLEQIGDETAGKRKEEFLAALGKDERPEMVDLGRRFAFVARIEQLGDLEEPGRQQLIDDVASYMQESSEITGSHVGLAMQVASSLEEVSVEQAIAAYNLFAKYVEASKDEQVAAIAEAMRGSARRLDLPGNVIEVAGTTFAGEEFNISQYKGKVVLVDFWATWCGPCIQEIPNVLDNYEKYHGKGFEVVGVNLDDNPEALESFLKENELPWVQLFEKDEEKRAQGNAIANYYGISSIPTMILVDQEGKVVSLEARDERLDELLAELLGPPEEPPAAEQPTSKVPTKQPLIKK
ncbi:MAG: redoxin domain-containing protein [Planctomycetaceae bacterium]|nr:redoxin domain-containing protein [Planctomycetaceae bacterium]